MAFSPKKSFVIAEIVELNKLQFLGRILVGFRKNKPK